MVVGPGVGACALEVRVKAPAGQPLTATVNGEACEVRRLGHNAPNPRGFHPYLLITQIEFPPTAPMILNLNGALSAVRLAPFAVPN